MWLVGWSSGRSPLSCKLPVNTSIAPPRQLHAYISPAVVLTDITADLVINLTVFREQLTAVCDQDGISSDRE